MTTVEIPMAGSLGELDKSGLEPSIEQAVIENQQRAKELTEKAAAQTNPSEREALLRQALDHEVQARMQSENPEALSVDAPTSEIDQDDPELALEIGLEALAGPLLDMASPIVLKEALIELDGGLNADAVGGFFVNVDGQDASPVSTPQASLEPALPPIEEVLEGTVTPTDSQSIPKNIGTAPKLGDIESVAEGEEEPLVPANVGKGALIAEASMPDEEVLQIKPNSGQTVEVLDTTEVTITKTEVVDPTSPTRKPRKLEIRSKMKPRKLEIRSSPQSP